MDTLKALGLVGGALIGMILMPFLVWILGAALVFAAGIVVVHIVRGSIKDLKLPPQ
jgi:hypothetical protein